MPSECSVPSQYLEEKKIVIIHSRRTANRTKTEVSFEMAAGLADHSSNKRKGHQSDEKSDPTSLSFTTESYGSPKPRSKTKYARNPPFPGQGRFKRNPNDILFEDTPEHESATTGNLTTTMDLRLDPFDAHRIQDMQGLEIGMEQSSIMGMNAGIPQMVDQQMGGHGQGRVPERPSFAEGSCSHMGYQVGQEAYPTPENTSMPTYNTVGGPNMASNFGVISSSDGSSVGQYGHRTGVGDSRRGLNTSLVATTGLPATFRPDLGMGQDITAANMGAASPNAGPLFDQYRGNATITPAVINPFRTTDYPSHGSRVAFVSRHSMAGGNTLVAQIPTPACMPPTSSCSFNPRSNTRQGQDHSYNFKEPETLGPRVVLHNPKYDPSSSSFKWFKDIAAGDVLTVKAVTGDAAHVSRFRHGQDEIAWVPQSCFEPLTTGENCACPSCTAVPTCEYGQPRKGCNCKCFCLHEGHPNIEVLKADVEKFIRGQDAKRLPYQQVLPLLNADFSPSNFGARDFRSHRFIGAAVTFT